VIDIDELSIRAINVFRSLFVYGGPTSKRHVTVEDVEAINVKDIPNCGRKTKIELHQWAWAHRDEDLVARTDAILEARREYYRNKVRLKRAAERVEPVFAPVMPNTRWHASYHGGAVE
jgi:hypothetical protein